jgi:hypothetical protein
MVDSRVQVQDTYGQTLMYCLLESLELNIELPIMLEMDNSGAVDIANSWSVRGRMCHMDLYNYFLHELKDHGILVIGY